MMSQSATERLTIVSKASHKLFQLISMFQTSNATHTVNIVETQTLHFVTYNCYIILLQIPTDND